MHINPFLNITLGLQHGSYNTPARDYRPIGDAREIETVDRNPYKYKYNAKEYQDELGLNVTAMDFRQYDNALGRFLNPDVLAEVSMSWTPYRFAFNNPLFWSDATGLYEISKNGIKTTKPGEHEIVMNYFKNYDGSSDFNEGAEAALNAAGFELDVVILSDVVAHGKSNNKKAGLGIVLDVAESVGGLSGGVLKDRFKYGEKYGDKTITLRTKLGPGINVNSKSLKKIEKGGKLAGRTTRVLVAADVALSGEIRASHVLTATMIGINAVPIAGNTISGIYFGADLITMGVSYFMKGEAKGIGDYLDQSLDDASVTSDGGVMIEMYEGFY